MRTFYPTIRFKRTNPAAPTPRYAKAGDAGMDLCSMETVCIRPHETVLVGSGIAVAIPEGYFGDVRPRSGMATKRGVTLANAPAVIDSGYRGEILLPLHNLGNEAVTVHAGERVCQMVIAPYGMASMVEVEELDESERGTSGFGSSGYERL